MYRDNRDYREENREIRHKLADKDFPTELRVDDKGYPEDMISTDIDYEKVQGGKPDVEKILEGTYKLTHNYLRIKNPQLRDEDITTYTVLSEARKLPNLFLKIIVEKDNKGNITSKWFPTQLLVHFHGIPCRERSRGVK